MTNRRAMGVRGFTLIELAVVVAIVGLLLGAILVPLGTQIQNQRNREAEQQLERIRDAMMGFAMINGRLPCPDALPPDPPGGAASARGADLDGVEDLADGVERCESPVGSNRFTGVVPWATLGLPSLDPWGRLFRYVVSEEFTYRTSPGAPCAVGQIDQCDLANGSAVLEVSVNTRGSIDPIANPGRRKELVQLSADGMVAFVWSTGPNGIDGIDLLGSPYPAPDPGTDEAENADGDDTYVIRTPSSGTAGCDDNVEGQPFCEFDDLAIWIPAPILANALVTAGQLP
ncbi:MAG: type II secretion system protein [Ectothiorhodospiraceae bacterium]|nr:type II secretion system protein [Chromatiales bacterium]MCP5156794.1 type II secretion system protein [Ectothiorhodospiraceae bacterium]